MKHCAKKLLGFAFALALCLAVGGTALAQAPEFSDVPPALPEQEMLAYEPNVTTAEGMNTVTGDDYTVTIPTSVEVKSTTDTGTLEVKGTLEVTAEMKQWRTLLIEITPQTPSKSGAWTLKYNGSASAGTTLPQVEYNLPEFDVSFDEKGNYEWLYDGSRKHLSVYSPKLGGSEDVRQTKTITAKLAVTVPHPEQATMSGTYSDTLTFKITPQKTCITYTINVYEQELQLAADGKSVKAVDMVDTNGDVIGTPTPVRTEILEYPTGWDNEYTWSYDGEESDADLRWEKATATMNTHQDANGMTENKVDANNNVTINLNRRYKWYYLDVNGATDYTAADVVGGNQGDHIGSFVEIMLSVDGVDWTDWFWQGDGDDYWAKLPYGIHFKLGFHHVKNGYVYDTGAGTLEGNGVRIIANGTETQTATGETVGTSTYYVYTGEMTGEPTGTDNYNNVRYCYIPCYKKGLTYIANGGTGGTESVNDGNPPRTNVLYDENGTLKTPAELNITAPDGKSFAGWSTSADYPTTGKLYQPDDDVSTIQWEKYTAAEMAARPQGDEQKRVLYAIWGYDITVQFEDKTGYTADGTKDPVFGSPMAGYSFTLTGQAVEKGKGWTLDLTNSDVITAIDNATTEAKSDAGDTRTTTTSKDVWKIGKYTEDGHTFDYTEECTISAAELERGTRTLMIQRRRYLLSVISVDINTFDVIAIATNAGVPTFGTFNVTINDGNTKAGVIRQSHCQVGLNYGAKYTVDTMEGMAPYHAMDNVVLKSLAQGDELEKGWFGELVVPGESYTSCMTGKQTGIHYYKSTGDLGGDGYIGDPVRVVFSDVTTGSDTPMPGPSLAPGLSSPTPSASVALRYHAGFVPEDALAETVKTVYCSAADVTVHPCMFKRAGYAFVGWNTEEDGTGTWYWVNGVPLTNWRAGETVDLYAQWRKTAVQKPVWDDPDPVDPADPDAPPEWIDDSFDADFGADPDPLPEDPDAQPDDADAAFGVDPDPLPDELDDAFGIDPGGDSDTLLTY